MTEIAASALTRRDNGERSLRRSRSAPGYNARIKRSFRSFQAGATKDWHRGNKADHAENNAEIHVQLSGRTEKSNAVQFDVQFSARARTARAPFAIPVSLPRRSVSQSTASIRQSS